MSYFATQTCPMQVSVSIAAAAGVHNPNWHRKAAYVAYAGGALGTIQVQISADDGLTWHNKGAALTTSGFVDIPEPCTNVRLSTTVAITVGTVTAIIAGY